MEVNDLQFSSSPSVISATYGFGGENARRQQGITLMLSHELQLHQLDSTSESQLSVS